MRWPRLIQIWISRETAACFALSPPSCGALAATGVWPRWLSRLAVAAAALYALRTGTLFATDGPFAADGLLGLRVPVVAISSWWLAAGLFLLVSPPCSSERQSGAPS